MASLVAVNADTTLWARNSEVVLGINGRGGNSKYLPGGKLHRALKASEDLKRLVSQCDVLIMGIPSQSFRSILQEVRPYLRAWVPVISLSKGLEKDSQLRMS